MKKLIFIAVYLVLVVPCAAEVIIVDDDWPYDFNNVQAAIDYSSNGDFILVFPGTYTGPGNRDIDFLGKAITVRSIDPADPCIVAQTVIDCNGSITDLHRGFYFHNSEDANSILDGFTVTNSFSRGAIRCSGSSPMITSCIITGNEAFDGGGIYCEDYSCPIITSCTISHNNTGRAGGGIFCDEASPTITDCTIGYNTADWGGGIFCNEASPTISNCKIIENQAGEGGGIYCYFECRPTITNCTITDNSASSDGGGIFCEFECRPTITNCKITGNSARYYDGGGIFYTASSPIVTGCTISGNKARDGGGIFSGGYDYKYDSNLPTFINCIITDNFAEDDGGGIFCKGEDSLPVMNSCIVWGNSDSSGTGLSAQIYNSWEEWQLQQVWFSCIKDDNPDDANILFEELGNIDDDPCFVDPGFWVDAGDPNIIVEPNDPNAVWLDGDYHLLAASPCIETGDPYYAYHPGDTDMDDQPRRMGQYVDMGIDEVELSVIVVTKPKGGEVWSAGSTHEIKWDSYDVTGTVDISYSTNNGTDWVIIDNNVPDTGNFLWHLPSAVDSNQCIVAIEPNVISADLISVESGPFTIHPYFSWPPMPWWPGCPHMKSGPRYGCVKWKFQTDGPLTAGVAVGYNRIYVPCEDGNLYALNDFGGLLWTYDVNSPLVGSPAIGRNGTIYVGAENGKVYAIGKWGCLLWTHTTDGPIYSSLAVSADGNIYTCSQDGTLYALGPDGSELWTFETAGPGVAPGAILASPAIGSDGTIYITGFYDPNLYALDPNDGSVKWNCTFSDPCDDPNSPKLWSFASPVVAPDGTIYQTMLHNPERITAEPRPWMDAPPFYYDSRLYAIDSNNGNVLWATNMTETATQEEMEYPQPPEPNYWFEQYYADMSDDQQRVLMLYPHTYTYLDWQFIRYYRVGNSGWSDSALAPDGTIYVSFDDPYLRAIDPNGTIKWVTRLGMMGGFTLTVGGNGLIYAACDDGTLYVVDPSGEEISRFEGSGGLSFPTITAGRTIIVSDADNILWAISPYACWGKPMVLHRPEDLNGDWAVNIIDFATLAASWLDRTDTYWPSGFEEVPVYPEGDIDKSLHTDFADLAQLANQWLK